MSRYISNHTMGEMWRERNCYQCAHDHDWTHRGATEQSESCPIFLALILDEYPIEGLTRHDDKPWPSSLVCERYSPCLECFYPPEEPPKPRVEVPGQLELLRVERS